MTLSIGSGAAGTSAARFLLRTAVGGTMIAHGIKHARSLNGTAGWFESIGFRRPALQAKASAVVEIGAGIGLVAGAATPVAASAVVGTMAVATRSVHAPNGFFITSEGWEYVMNLTVASIALAGLGPGRWSVDHVTGWDRTVHGGRAVALTAILGLSAAAAQLSAFFTPPTAA